MQVEHVAPFLGSAFEILSAASARPRRGSLSLLGGPAVSTRELTGLVAVTGDLDGVVSWGMSVIAAARLREALGVGDNAAAAPTVAELVRDLCARGLAALHDQGLICTGAEPVVLEGYGAALVGPSPRLLVPVLTEYGDLEVGVALYPSRATDTQVREDAA